MSITIKHQNYEYSLSEDDIINPDDYFSGYSDTLWILHDHGTVIGAWFGKSEQDCLDELADSGRLDRYMLTQEEYDAWPEDKDLTFLGNASEPFDLCQFDVNSIFSVKMSPPKVVVQLQHQQS